MKNRQKLDLEKALESLLDIAYKRNISNQKLCEGVYDYRTFKRILKGEKNVTYNLVFSLAEKLNVSLSLLIEENIHSEQVIDPLTLQLEFYSLLISRSYDQLPNLYKNIDFENCDNKQTRQIAFIIKSIYLLINEDVNKVKSITEPVLQKMMKIIELEYSSSEMFDEYELTLLLIRAIIATKDKDYKLSSRISFLIRSFKNERENLVSMINILVLINNEYCSKNYIVALEIGEMALNDDIFINDAYQTRICLMLLSLICLEMGEYEKSYDYYSRSIELSHPIVAKYETKIEQLHDKLKEKMPDKFID